MDSILVPGKTLHLVDTVPAPFRNSSPQTKRLQLAAVRQAVSRGGHVTNLDRIRSNFAEWPSARLVQGAVPAVLPGSGIDRVAFLHLDMNCAGPERKALRYFWPRLSAGLSLRCPPGRAYCERYNPPCSRNALGRSSRRQ
jgi:hypothetical protein